MLIEINIWIYWLFCSIVGILVIVNKKLAISLLNPCRAINLSEREKGYYVSLVLGWSTTLLASTVSILFTLKQETGHYQLSDLLLFCLLNGVLEQFMFIFWFLLGCYLGQKIYPNSSLLAFIFGYVVYAVYSGLIHAWFWSQVLPKHEPFTYLVLFLSLMSFFWMWLLWRYRAIFALISMHFVIDFLTIGNLHFNK